MYRFHPYPLPFYPCDNLCCVSNLLNDLPYISGRYPEKVSVEGAVNQRKLTPGLSRIRAHFLK